jgi:hypothetical protein
VHAVPGGSHAPTCMQKPVAHLEEQHSGPTAQAAPFPRHARLAAGAVHARASSPDAGAEVSGADVSPDGAEISPDVRADVSPDVGAEISPDVRADVSPDAGAEISPDAAAEASLGPSPGNSSTS